MKDALMWWNSLRDTNLQLNTTKDKGYYTDAYFGRNQRMYQYVTDDEILLIYNNSHNMNLIEPSIEDFWSKLDKDYRRTCKMLSWLIMGQGQHCITPMMFTNITPERIEELYNVDFGQ